MDEGMQLSWGLLWLAVLLGCCMGFGLALLFRGPSADDRLAERHRKAKAESNAKMLETYRERHAPTAQVVTDKPPDLAEWVRKSGVGFENEGMQVTTEERLHGDGSSETIVTGVRMAGGMLKSRSFEGRVVEATEEIREKIRTKPTPPPLRTEPEIDLGLSLMLMRRRLTGQDTVDQQIQWMKNKGLMHPKYPPRGQLLSETCRGTDLFATYASGDGTTYDAVREYSSPKCGAV